MVSAVYGCEAVYYSALASLGGDEGMGAFRQKRVIMSTGANCADVASYVVMS
jgi:hypothetical protein